MKYKKENSDLSKSSIKLVNYLPNIGINTAKEEIIEGLKADPKYISSKFFYDEKGSRLFEEITTLDEYYPTRTEKAIISAIEKNLDIDFSQLNLIDLGSGDYSKIRLLFRRLSTKDFAGMKYFPVDISQSTLERAGEKLLNEFPALKIEGIVADFIHQLHLMPGDRKKLFCFFGSTIGNFQREEIKEFLRSLGEQMRLGDGLLLGLDMVKDIYILEKAYNDTRGITAAFNKNILHVVNNFIETDFRANDFDHLAFYNPAKKRIEMHLKTLKDIAVQKTDKPFITLYAGETIHTENSHKFDQSDIELFARWAGLNVDKILSDDNQWFSLVYYTK